MSVPHLFFVSGPTLPIILGGHEMVSIGYDLIVIGGGPKTNGLSGLSGLFNFNSLIYKLSCSNHVCKWDKLQEELKTNRGYFTAIPLPDEFIDCN